MAREKITTTLDPDLWKRAEDVGKKIKKGRNEIIEEALQEYLPGLEMATYRQEFINNLNTTE